MRIRFVLAALALCIARGAFAQDIAPGPMSRGHDHLTGPLSCAKCHEGGGVPDKKCLGCHDHKDLRLRIDAGKGFHATEDVKSKACKDCHPDHREEPPGSGKGRRTTIDWRPFGGQRNFEHQRTGWPLEGAHRFTKCEKCHDQSSKKTGLPIYLGASAECTSCHKNPHTFSDVRLNDCLVCHTYSNREVKNLGATKFDHDKTKFPLDGNHVKVECKSCHEKTDKFTVSDRDFSDCKGCHEDSHKSVISKGKRKCFGCHATKTKFALTKFDHDKETKFPIRGKHEKNHCKDCHKLGSEPVAPETRCISCHKDFHEGRFAKNTCEECHSEVGWRTISFAHDKETKFDLTGAHSKASCVSCHRDRDPKHFEKLPEALGKECARCHAHSEAHCGQFGLENCQRCHVRGGDRTSRFDHDLTRFPLTGAHKKVECEKCHLPARLGASDRCRAAIKYAGQDPECAACHNDVHNGTLGKDCTKCHSPGRDFRSLVFDHNQDTKFPLTGFHQLVECAECHPKSASRTSQNLQTTTLNGKKELTEEARRDFDVADVRCVGCHKEDDAHKLKLGDDCAKCHETTGGAPKFDHDIFTKFPLGGVHARIECARCHFIADPSTKKGEKVLVAVAPPGAQLDFEFQVGGKECRSCHPDPHRVRESLDCGRCHHLAGWSAPDRNGYHERAGFALNGAHTVLACQLCHDGSGRLTGRGESCGRCHVQDDAHAGSFGGDCGQCHEQSGWLPTSFSHMTTGFVLEGIHRTLDCRDCHGAGTYFLGRRCYHCHLRDLKTAPWHLEAEIFAQLGTGNANQVYVGDWQNAKKTIDCGECHNQFLFTKATFRNPASERRKP
ncbi:MAG: hypothetical protein HYV07_11555 [Deltaproteobacteria bacterium]|nr:hypothetical protein [Deltaproteobacteria bacterium]